MSKFAFEAFILQFSSPTGSRSLLDSHFARLAAV